MPVEKLKAFLDTQNIKYVCISHSKAYTALEVAASAHISGKELAKTVIIRVNGKMAMAVLPATQRVNFGLLKSVTGTGDVKMTTEQEFKDRFPECEVGAMPPFGNLYDMEVFVEHTLAEDEEIAFNAGSHTEVIKLAYKDFESLVHPKVLVFST